MRERGGPCTTLLRRPAMGAMALPTLARRPVAAMYSRDARVASARPGRCCDGSRWALMQLELEVTCFRLPQRAHGTEPSWGRARRGTQKDVRGGLGGGG